MIWPNPESAANSDPWLIANHDRITQLRPRVLAVNFVHGLSEGEARAQLEALRPGFARVVCTRYVENPRSVAPGDVNKPTTS